ncbi:MAG: pantoate--beta-alanine ligase [Kordiimonadaceae bacterium]|nr:pantoate--beta-alanine ligase [Kordiimonadaceae bacterium]
MSNALPHIRSITELREQVALWRNEGLTVGLVPTMGALHHGHLSLVEAIASHADKIVVSIFVNPTQFGVGEDLDKYPRQEQADREKLATTPADLLYAPSVDEMYPDGFCSNVTLSANANEPCLTEILEGAERPGHFDGVATVVSKLLLQCLPDVAIFGEKDYQQLAVIRQFVQDLNIPVKIMGGTLIREADGLAASSRNIYLNTQDRKTAAKLNRVLKNLVQAVEGGQNLRAAEAAASAALLEAGFTAVDYVCVADGTTLQPLEKLTAGARVLAVARLAGIRLLDNMAIGAR